MKEKLIIILISIVAIVLVNFPTAYSYLTQKPGVTYLGRSAANSEDTYTYLSFIEQAKQGRILFENLYTTEPQSVSLFRPSYIVIGKLAVLANLTSMQAFQAARLILTMLFFIVLYKFISRFFDKPYERIVCYTIVLLASGFGTTNWVVESLTFFSLGEAPHFILSQILLVGGFYFFLDFIKTRNFRFFGYSSLLFLFLSLEHPFTLITVALVVFISLLMSEFSIVVSAALGFLSSFGILYQYIEISRNPIFAAWQAQNVQVSPSIMDYLLGYGLLIPFAIAGIENIISRKEFKYKFILIWIFVIAVAIYVPFRFQRRLIEGFDIPLSIVATAGLFYISSLVGKYKMDLIIFGLIGLCVGSIYSIKTSIATVQDPDRNYYFYIDNDELSALNWLETKTTFKDSILANKDYGNIIPGIIGRKVFVGHEVQTTNINDKIKLINTFLLNKDPGQVHLFFKNNGITYIFLGKNDTITRYGFMPQNFSFLEDIYDKNGVTIYKVLNN